MILPTEAAPLLAALAPTFTPPTAQRFATRLAAALLTTGRRTVANLLRTPRGLAPGHPTDYHRVLSRPPWSGLDLGCPLAAFLLRHLVPDGPVVLVGGDAVAGHQGTKVYGEARHRDPVPSTKADTAWRYGHKWVVLAVLVRFPFATRPRALPILVDLYRSRAGNARRRRPHRTPAQLMCRLLRALSLRFPERRFVFVGDSGDGTHEVARSCPRHRARLTLVSKPCPEANLDDPPPPYSGEGRPRVRGARLPKPSQAVAAARKRRRWRVAWYGGGTRRVEVVSGTGHWHESGRGLGGWRWVFVADRGGTHRDEDFFTTDPALEPAAAIGRYWGRWNIGTTFQERRSCLGLETARAWCRRTVLRAGPCPLGLYSVAAVPYHHLPAAKRVGPVEWEGEAGATFSDALGAVRRWRWAEGVLEQAGAGPAVAKLPEPVRELLFSALATAA